MKVVLAIVGFFSGSLFQRPNEGAEPRPSSSYGVDQVLKLRAPKRTKQITYLPHEAVAEVSKDKEPIGRERAEFNWFESQLMSDSNELRVK